MLRLTILILGLSLAACASRSTNSAGLELMSESAYFDIVDQNTRIAQKYNGLYNTVDIKATLVSTQVGKAQLEQNARLYEWDRSKFQAESAKVDEKQKKETEVFLSFFTPDRKNDDLSKSTSQWRLYLEVDGRRWEGRAKKIKQQVVEINGLYKYHSRFATAYSVTFPIATADVEGKAPVFTVTGPVDIVKLPFESTK